MEDQSTAWGKCTPNSPYGLESRRKEGARGEKAVEAWGGGTHRPPPLLQHEGPFFRVGGLRAGLEHRLCSKERFLTWPSSQYTFTECLLQARDEASLPLSPGVQIQNRRTTLRKEKWSDAETVSTYRMDAFNAWQELVLSVCLHVGVVLQDGPRASNVFCKPYH